MGNSSSAAVSNRPQQKRGKKTFDAQKGVMPELDILQPQPLSPEGSLSSNWCEWKKNFEIYLELLRIQTKDARAPSLFLHCIGQYGCDIFNMLSISEPLSITEIFIRFEEYCNNSASIFLHRHKFFTTKQYPTQSFESFFDKLRLHLPGCYFGKLQNDLLLTQIISGVNNSALRERLLSMPSLALNEAIAECRALELSSTEPKCRKTRVRKPRRQRSKQPIKGTVRQEERSTMKHDSALENILAPSENVMDYKHLNSILTNEKSNLIKLQVENLLNTQNPKCYTNKEDLQYKCHVNAAETCNVDKMKDIDLKRNISEVTSASLPPSNSTMQFAANSTNGVHVASAPPMEVNSLLPPGNYTQSYSGDLSKIPRDFQTSFPYNPQYLYSAFQQLQNNYINNHAGNRPSHGFEQQIRNQNLLCLFCKNYHQPNDCIYNKTHPSKCVFNCKFCGSSHIKGSCPAYGKTCRKCGKLNHIETVCKSR